MAGLNTLLQALFGTRLPAVVGGSFTYVIPIAYIVGDSSLQRITDNHEVSLSTSSILVVRDRGAMFSKNFLDIVLHLIGY